MSDQIQRRGQNEQGNRYDVRVDPNTGQQGYHYSNTDNSYYYQNPNGNKYYNDGEQARYTSPGGYTKYYNKYEGNMPQQRR